MFDASRERVSGTPENRWHMAYVNARGDTAQLAVLERTREIMAVSFDDISFTQARQQALQEFRSGAAAMSQQATASGLQQQVQQQQQRQMPAQRIQPQQVATQSQPVVQQQAATQVQPVVTQTAAYAPQQWDDGDELIDAEDSGVVSDNDEYGDEYEDDEGEYAEFIEVNRGGDSSDIAPEELGGAMPIDAEAAMAQAFGTPDAQRAAAQQQRAATAPVVSGERQSTPLVAPDVQSRLRRGGGNGGVYAKKGQGSVSPKIPGELWNTLIERIESRMGAQLGDYSKTMLVSTALALMADMQPSEVKNLDVDAELLSMARSGRMAQTDEVAKGLRRLTNLIDERYKALMDMSTRNLICGIESVRQFNGLLEPGANLPEMPEQLNVIDGTYFDLVLEQIEGQAHDVLRQHAIHSPMESLDGGSNYWLE